MSGNSKCLPNFQVISTSLKPQKSITTLKNLNLDCHYFNDVEVIKLLRLRVHGTFIWLKLKNVYELKVVQCHFIHSLVWMNVAKRR